VYQLNCYTFLSWCCLSRFADYNRIKFFFVIFPVISLDTKKIGPFNIYAVFHNDDYYGNEKELRIGYWLW